MTLIRMNETLNYIPEQKNKKKFWKYIYVIVFVIIFIRIATPAIKEFMRGPQKSEFMEQLSNISVSEINRIEVGSGGNFFSNELINSEKSKLLFKEAMNDLQPFSGGRYYHHNEIEIRMFDTKGNLFRFKTWFMGVGADEKESVYMLLSRMSDESEQNFIALGQWRSEELYKWRKYIKF